MEGPRTTVITLRHGLVISGERHTEAEIREASAGDLFAAEADTSSAKPITYAAALLAQQLVRIGSFTGPFTLGMLGKLKTSDLELLQEARLMLSAEGEGEQPG